MCGKWSYLWNSKSHYLLHYLPFDWHIANCVFSVFLVRSISVFELVFFLSLLVRVFQRIDVAILVIFATVKKCKNGGLL